MHGIDLRSEGCCKVGGCDPKPGVGLVNTEGVSARHRSLHDNKTRAESDTSSVLLAPSAPDRPGVRYRAPAAQSNYNDAATSKQAAVEQAQATINCAQATVDQLNSSSEATSAVINSAQGELMMRTPHSTPPCAAATPRSLPRTMHLC